LKQEEFATLRSALPTEVSQELRAILAKLGSL